MNRQATQRLTLVREAVKDEHARVNQAVSQGKVALVHTFCGDHVLDSVDSEFWYHTHKVGQSNTYMNTRSWAGCNDGDWADIMRQLGLERNPLFVKS